MINSSLPGLRSIVLVLGVGILAHVAVKPETTERLSAPTPIVDSGGECNIKGNVSHNGGKRIFHVPGQEDYDSTIISAGRGERWFCSEDEAVAAGWKKATR